MKAMVYRSYGPPGVLHLEDVPKPQPKDDEVLIRVMATSVSAGDWRLRKADPFLARIYNGLFRPKKVNILGFDCSGVIEAVGGNVEKFNVGDEIFAFTGLRFGGYAEYRCLPEIGNDKKGLVALKPSNLSFQQAAALPVGSLTALTFLRDNGRITKGQSVLVYGASGSVGTYAVQIAKHFGASVTGVCSTANIEMVKELGADNMIDYTKEDLSSYKGSFDIVFDTVGKCSRSLGKRLLKEKGVFLHTFQGTKYHAIDLDVIRELCEQGSLKPVVDRVYEFEDIPQAHQYVEGFHKKGNVVINGV